MLMMSFLKLLHEYRYEELRKKRYFDMKGPGGGE